jgi:hypothetical protein
MPYLPTTCRAEGSLTPMLPIDLEKIPAPVPTPCPPPIPEKMWVTQGMECAIGSMRFPKGHILSIDDRSKLAKEIFQKCLELLDRKGRSYSGSEDVNLNFKENARRLGMTKFQVWAVYANKHVDSINNAIKSNPELPVDHSESLEGRVIDMINYGICLLALLEEGK